MRKRTEKKAIERAYMAEARRACDLFPDGEARDHENPDFLFTGADGRTLGVELTELCREADRREAARLGYVVPKAKTTYLRMPGAAPVDVSPVFSQSARDTHVDVLAAGLAQFVYDHRHKNEFIEDYRLMPPGFDAIGVYPPVARGEWREFRAFNTTLATRELLASRVAEKTVRLSDYRSAAQVVWLLIVNDLFLGPGEVAVRDEDLAGWTFDFDFDRVFLFQRQPGGTGRVTELMRSLPRRLVEARKGILKD